MPWPELMAEMSLETGLAVCLVSMELAPAVGPDEDGLSRTYALAVLKHIECGASPSGNAAVTGGELVTVAGGGDEPPWDAVTVRLWVTDDQEDLTT